MIFNILTFTRQTIFLEKGKGEKTLNILTNGPWKRLQGKIKQNNITMPMDIEQNFQIDAKSDIMHNIRNPHVNSLNSSIVFYPNQSNQDENKCRRSISFTPYPAPYKSKQEHLTTSILSQTQVYQLYKKYQCSQSQPSNLINQSDAKRSSTTN